MKRLLFALVLIPLAGVLLTSCRQEPAGPATQELRDGEWTGYGEGRNGAIVAKVQIAGHQVEQVTIVSQSEAVFAQDAINAIVAKAVGRQEAMSVEVDGVTSATLTSTGVIGAINMALEAVTHYWKYALPIWKKFRARREVLIDALKDVPKIRFIRPAATFYLFVDISETGLDSRTFCDRLLEQEHVAVTPGLSFGDAFDGYIRLAFTLNDDMLREGATRIRRFIESLEGSN